jgi:molybdenum cofactor cytidylyltransferase
VNAPFAAIILAGGLATRMKRFKPLLPLGGETITDRVIATFLGTGVDVLVVAGYRRDDIKAVIRKWDITIVDNPNYEQGMFSSVQAGVRHLTPSYRAFFIHPVDIPLVRPATFRRLMAAAADDPAKLYYPVFRGRRGHPPLVPSGLIPDILGWRQDGGLKAVFDDHKELASEVPVADSFILFDIDTPGDYSKLLERFHRYEVPTDKEADVIQNDICRVAPDRIKHGLKVAELAVTIGRALDASGHKVDIEVVRLAAMLHDIAKGQRKHDIAGGKILRELGFGKVADIVSVHSDLAGGNLRLPLEAKLVYLADKLVEGERLVTLEQRYDSSNRRFGLTAEIQAAITQRLEVARNVKQELESMLGHTLESILYRRTD